MTFYGIAYVVALVIPGIIFKRFYYQGRFAKQFSQGLFADRLVTSIFWSIIIQVITVYLYFYLYKISYNSITKEIQTIYAKVVKDEFPEIQFEYVRHTLQYLGLSIIVGVALGIVLYQIVRYFKLDIKLSIFRFSNHWHYYFSGDILKTKEFRVQKRNYEIFSTDIDVVVKDNDGRTNMFTGTLTQYVLDKTGDLETIFLTDAKRWKIPSNKGIENNKKSKQEKHGDEYNKPIPGDCFIIPYGNILNMNVRYNFLQTQPYKNKSKIGNLFIVALTIVSFLCFFVALVYPWFVASGFWNKLLSSFSLFAAWVFLMGFSMSLNPKVKEENHLTTGGKILVAMLFVIFSILGLWIADQIAFHGSFPFISLTDLAPKTAHK